MKIMKEIPEITLQNYIKFNFQEFDKDFVRVFGSSIESVAFNHPKDRFPDLIFTLKNGDEIPVEVEWKTSNFDHEGHPNFAWFRENKGLVMVGVLENDVNLGLE